MPAACAAARPSPPECRWQDLGDRDRARVEARPKRVPLDQLGGDEVELGGAADLVDDDDVRVIEGRCGARLVLEAAAAIRVREILGSKNLEGDHPAERRVLGTVDRPHAAMADTVDNAIAPELDAGQIVRVGNRGIVRGPHRRPTPA